MELLKQPMKHCPEIIFLSVIRTQVCTRYTYVATNCTLSYTLLTARLEIGTARSDLKTFTSFYFESHFIFNCSS